MERKMRSGGEKENEGEWNRIKEKKNKCRKSFLTLSDNQFQLRLFIIVVIAFNGSLKSKYPLRKRIHMRMCWKLNYLMLRWSKCFACFDVVVFLLSIERCHCYCATAVVVIVVVVVVVVAVMQDPLHHRNADIEPKNNNRIGYVHLENICSSISNNVLSFACFRYFDWMSSMFWFSLQFVVLVVNRYYVQFLSLFCFSRSFSFSFSFFSPFTLSYTSFLLTSTWLAFTSLYLRWHVCFV